MICCNDRRNRRKRALKLVLLGFAALLTTAVLVCMGIYGFVDPELKSVNFSLQPIVHAGLDVDVHGTPTPPRFNLTLHARTTQKHRYCGQEASVRVAYAGVVIAADAMDPFCVEPKGVTSVLTATASPGWPALPLQFRERIRSDRGRAGGGGPEIEVDVGAPTSMWVRCRTALDAKQASRCKFFRFTHS